MITLETRKLREKVQELNLVAVKKATFPILANICIDVSQEGLRLRATDQESALTTNVELTTHHDSWSTTINAANLLKILKNWKGASIQLGLGKDNALLLANTSGSQKLKINGETSEEYPELTGVGAITHNFLIPGKELLECLTRVAYAQSTDETRYNINSVCVEPLERSLRFIATDGHRLAMFERKQIFEDLGSKYDKQWLLPTKSVAILIKLLKHVDDDIYIYISDAGSIKFSFADSVNGCNLQCKLIDGEYPDYRQVIPSERSTTIRIDYSRFVDAVKFVQQVISDKDKILKLRIKYNQASLYGDSPDLGKAVQNLDDAVEVMGSEVTIGIASNYLLEALKHANNSERDGNLTLSFNGKLAPIVVENSAIDGYIQVIMPCRFE